MNPILTYTNTGTFEQQYNVLRAKDGRMYSDAAVKLLPETTPQDHHYKEWLQRKQTLQRLLHIIKQKGDKLKILEVGCGNGWLAAQLATNTKADVTAIDINRQELHQASRVFKQIPNLHFIHGRLQDEILQDKKFDIILFAASIQFFPSLKKIVNTAIPYLTLQGEIHITDTIFYPQKELDIAKQITKNNLTQLGCTGLNAFLFHHSTEDLKKCNAELIYNPRNIINRWLHKSPCYHAMIKNRFQ